jgi:hypothetical protein
MSQPQISMGTATGIESQTSYEKHNESSIAILNV